MIWVKILIVLLLIVFCYTLYLTFPIYRTMNIAQIMMANQSSYEQHPNKPDKYILVAGDSTAVGIGANDPKDSIAGRLGKQFPNADITNLGVSGYRLIDLISTLHTIEHKHYDLVVLQIGANDVTHFTPQETIKKELDEIIQITNKLSPKTIILTSGNIGNAPMFRWPLSTIISHQTLQVRKIFMNEIAKNKSTSYVDLYLDWKDDPMVKNTNKYYSPDKFHLSGDGYAIWYENLQKHL